MAANFICDKVFTNLKRHFAGLASYLFRLCCYIQNITAR